MSLRYFIKGCHRASTGPMLLQLGSVVSLVAGPAIRFRLVQTCPCWSREWLGLGDKLQGWGVFTVAATEGFSRVFAGYTGSFFYFTWGGGWGGKWTMIFSVPFQIKTRISVPTVEDTQRDDDTLEVYGFSAA